MESLSRSLTLGSQIERFNIVIEYIVRLFYLHCMHHPLSFLSYSYEPPQTPGRMKVDPLGAFTPSCERALSDARHARERGKHLRQETADLIEKGDKLRKAAANAVNSGIIQKMGETTSLKV